jgi:hypothetical protein
MGRRVWLLLAAFLIPTAVAAQEPAARHGLVATDRCVDCHFPREAPRPDPFELNGGFCQREQSAIWEQQDKHRRSFDLVASGSGRKLTDAILGFSLDEVLDLGPFERRPDGIVPAARFRADLPANDPRVTVVQSCLACHAPVQEDPAATGESFIEYGVSCQACHGPGGNYLAPHQEREWRLVKAEAKQRLFGLRDLRHPATRAALCASCHVGSFSDPDAPRFVKHEWYAKGHPPLPGLEQATFAAQMPAHWQPLASKLAAPRPIGYLSGEATAAQIDAFIGRLPRSIEIARSDLAGNYLAANAASFSPDPVQDMTRTKDVLVAALGVLGASASLVADAPAAEAHDFALFDCGACHHELRSQFASATRIGRGLPPGRPPGPEWPRPLATLAAGDSQELAAALAALDASYAARPFGLSASKRTAAASVRDTCGTLASQLAQQPLGEAAAAELFGQTTDPARYTLRREVRDYHAARQLAWATREVAKDLAGLPLRTGGNGFAPQHAAEFRTALAGLSGEPASEQPEAIGGRIDALFQGQQPSDWDGPLRLKLPAGQTISIVDNLPESLEALSRYDAAAFEARLRLLHERLATKPQP